MSESHSVASQTFPLYFLSVMPYGQVQVYSTYFIFYIKIYIYVFIFSKWAYPCKWTEPASGQQFFSVVKFEQGCSLRAIEMKATWAVISSVVLPVCFSSLIRRFCRSVTEFLSVGSPRNQLFGVLVPWYHLCRCIARK